MMHVYLINFNFVPQFSVAVIIDNPRLFHKFVSTQLLRYVYKPKINFMGFWFRFSWNESHHCFTDNLFNMGYTCIKEFVSTIYTIMHLVLMTLCMSHCFSCSYHECDVLLSFCVIQTYISSCRKLR